MTALILQARLDSTRLPRKALLSLGGRPMIQRVMEALKQIPCDIRILACPDDCLAEFGLLALKSGFVLVPGPKNDVLSRYCIAVRQYSVDWVIRATGDNPFVFSDAAISLLGEAQTLRADYAGYSGLPYGAGVELIKAQALLRAEQEAKAEPEREHVCPYLYTHPELFLLHRPMAPVPWQGLDTRLTVDTQADYERAVQLYQVLEPLAPDKRTQGETILSVYQKTFPPVENPPPQKGCP
jgi:spore coat polysaccharide biosynthesis protein SpsF